MLLNAALLAAVLIAFSLTLRGRDIEFLQISTHPLNFTFEADAALAFGYRAAALTRTAK